MKIPFTNRCPDLPSPGRASARAAGYDLRAAVDNQLTLAPGARALIATGISTAIPEGFEGQVRARSGLALRHGIALVNAPGTIDSDYRGEISVILVNLGQEPFTIQRGDRIAQLVICPVAICDLEQVDTLEKTARGSGGFGSTG
ncbi:MAG TPA: dUTP diphosphatase [Thermoanaerobaculia bacterium]|nr:dUTP diphosphatase [Thermoanaerobaculia bacterium]